MATNIPPHNLGEVCDALGMMIERIGNCVGEGYPFDLVWPRSLSLPVTPATVQKVVAALPPKVQKALAAGQGRAEERLAASILQCIDERVDITFEELMQIVPGPDFPTGGLIIGVDGVTSAYTTGRGRIVMRARAQIEEGSGGRPQLVITELPYQVNKAALIEKIAELVRDKRVEGIADVRDESDRHGMRVAIELRRDAEPQKVLNRLYQLTALQTAFAANLLALVDGQPRLLTLKMMLQHYLAHRKEVVTRRTQFELDKALQRSHILEGYMIALGNLDAVI
ncbi:MAG: hypothetical protein HYX89_02750, partial [Chloroflexi bacterium]|nr:hypothetical protein [Chloroflexota bacterium]